jgi:hypothetical protein
LATADREIKRLRAEGQKKLAAESVMGEIPWPESRYAELRRIYKDHQLTHAALSSVGRKFCEGFTKERERLNFVRQEHLDFLARASDFLLVPDATLGKYRPKLERIKFMADIKSGILPEIVAFDLVLSKAEKVHWQETVSLLEERVISRHYVGGSRGASIRVAKGITLRAGGYRGHSESVRGLTAVSGGKLTITSQRLILAGGQKAFNFPLAKVIGVGLVGRDRILITPMTGSPRLLQLSNARNREIVQIILGVAIGRQK